MMFPDMAWNLMSNPDRLCSSRLNVTGVRACSSNVICTLSVDLKRQAMTAGKVEVKKGVDGGRALH
jgi:hypothetical protein